MLSYLVLLFLPFVGCDCIPTPGSPVDTASGKIIGHAAPDTPNVTEYPGTPYAVPPLGNLRFEPPLPYRSRMTFDASAFSADCPFPPAMPVRFPDKSATFDRVFKSFISQTGNPQSE